MGLRTRLARWLNASEPPSVESASVAPPPSNADLLARVERLELERPAFVAELESMLETVQEILGRAESKRGRVAAAESRERKRDHQAEPELPLDPIALREAQKNEVRRRLREQGKLH